jgi:hypothetical protein
MPRCAHRAAPEAVTVTLAGSTSSLEVYVAEYGGADPVSPLDASVQSAGPSGNLSIGPIATTVDHDMLVAYCVGDTDCHPGSGFAARSTLNSNLLEESRGPRPSSVLAKRLEGSAPRVDEFLNRRAVRFRQRDVEQFREGRREIQNRHRTR